jgi:hypothetical protein
MKGDLDTTTPRWIWWTLAALLLLVWAVFSPALGFDLLSWDDDINLQRNPHLTGLSVESLRWMFFDLTYQWRYQPLAWLTWFTIYDLQGLNPVGYHLINILLHLANVVLVFCIARRLLALTKLGEHGAAVGALVTAAVWGVHPLRVETVVWAVELLYCQALFFLLCCFLAYLKAQNGGVPTAVGKRWLWVAFITFALSLFTFPLALGFVAVLVVTDIYLLRRMPESPRQWLRPEVRTVWLEKAPFVIVTLVAAAMNFLSRISATKIFSPPVSLDEFGVFPRAMQACYIWAYYVWRQLWPFDLTPVPPQLIEFDPSSWPFIGSALGIVGGSVVFFCWRQRWPALWSVWLIHLALLVPMLGLSEHPHFPGDRYSLIVSIGWAMLFGAGIAGAWRLSRRPLGLGLAVLVLVIALATLSVRQAPIWTNTFSLLGYVKNHLTETDHRIGIIRTLGLEHQRYHDFKGAVREFEFALSLQPDLERLRLELGDIQLRAGKYAAARNNYQAILLANPRAKDVHARLAQVCLLEERYAEAIPEWQAELTLDPGNYPVRKQLFRTLLLAGQMDAARTLLLALINEAQAAEPEILACELLFADALARQKDFDRAIQLAKQVLNRAQALGLTEMAQKTSDRLTRWQK